MGQPHTDGLRTCLSALLDYGLHLRPQCLTAARREATQRPDRVRDQAFSPRQIAILRGAAAFKSQREIGEALHLSRSTTRRAFGDLCRHLRVNSASELRRAAIALDLGVDDSPGEEAV